MLRKLAGPASLVAAIGCGVWTVREFYDGTIRSARNFYGVLRVWQAGDGDTGRRTLVHGTIMHGNQYLDPTLRKQPTTYYTASSGIGRAIESLHPRLEPLKVGVIGLGTGTIATWGAKGDVYRFYEEPEEILLQIDRGPAPEPCEFLSLEAGDTVAEDSGDGGPGGGPAGALELACRVPDGLRVFPAVRGQLSIMTGQAKNALVIPLTAVRGSVDEGEVLLDAPFTLINPLHYPWADAIRASDLPPTIS